jgi:PAS domain-containing protein
MGRFKITGKERVLDDNTFLVSETDDKGVLVFANDDFCEVAGFEVDALVGKPHNIIRHLDAKGY